MDSEVGNQDDDLYNYLERKREKRRKRLERKRRTVDGFKSENKVENELEIKISPAKEQPTDFVINDERSSSNKSIFKNKSYKVNQDESTNNFSTEVPHFSDQQKRQNELFKKTKIPTQDVKLTRQRSKITELICNHKKYFAAFFIIVLLIIITATLVPILIINFNNKNSTTTTTKSSSSYKIICKYGYQGRKCDECGIVYYKNNLKIVGGIKAVANSWPFVALLEYFSGTSYYYCGATLIDRETIISAGHCVLDLINIQGYKIYLGLQDTFNLSTATIMTVKQIILHPSFDTNSYLNDISIFKLSQEVQLTDKIQIACLPDSNINYYPTASNIEAFAMGWGTTRDGGSTISNTLNNVNFTIYSGDTCNTVLPTYSKNWNSQICAGQLSGGKDTCQGDSGGPIFIRDTVNNATKYVYVGITSYGDGCGLVGKAGIYTRLSYYLDWINSN